MNFRTRRIAKKYSINKIKDGNFVVSKNIEEPNYLKINNDKIFRVNIVGTIIDKLEMSGKHTLVIDDGGKITLRTFKDIDFSNLNIGEVVVVIGRPREYNNEIFIAVENIAKVDARWNNIRQKELPLYEKYYDQISDVHEEKNQIEEQPKQETSNLIEEEESIINNESSNTDPKAIYSYIISTIECLDKGEGANFIDVLNEIKKNNYNLEKAEMMINKMILDGDIFEILGNLKISH